MYVLTMWDLNKALDELTCQATLNAPYSTESNTIPGTGPAFLGSEAKKAFVMRSDGEIG